MDTKQKYDLVLFHKNCPDGFAAAWVLWSESKDSQFVAVDAGKFPSNLEIKDKRILIMDVCPLRHEIQAMIALNAHITILDHHKSNEKEIEGLKHENLIVVFDMKRSGCQLAWDFLRTTPRPWFLDIIADRDLWKWELTDSKAIGSYLFNLGFYSDWPKMNTLLDFKEAEKHLATEVGKALLHVEDRQIESAVADAQLCACTVDDKSYKVRLSGCTHNLASEVGARLSKSKDCDFAAIWRYNASKDEWWISCRAATDSDIDLSVICRKLEGGGHPKAAGFTIKNEKGALSKFFVPM